MNRYVTSIKMRKNQGTTCRIPRVIDQEGNEHQNYTPLEPPPKQNSSHAYDQDSKNIRTIATTLFEPRPKSHEPETMSYESYQYSSNNYLPRSRPFSFNLMSCLVVKVDRFSCFFFAGVCVSDLKRTNGHKMGEVCVI